MRMNTFILAGSKGPVLSVNLGMKSYREVKPWRQNCRSAGLTELH